MNVGYVGKNSSIKYFHPYQDNKCDKETVLLPIIPTLNYSKIRAGKNTFISWKRAHPTTGFPQLSACKIPDFFQTFSRIFFKIQGFSQ